MRLRMSHSIQINILICATPFVVVQVYPMLSEMDDEVWRM